MKSYLLFLDEGSASMLRLRGNRLEHVKYMGNQAFPIMDDFWKWWADAVSYLEGDEIDLCLVYDEVYDILNDAFLESLKMPSQGKSIWNTARLKHFIEGLGKYKNVSIKDREGVAYDLLGNAGHEQGRKTFYVNIDLSNTKLKKSIKSSLKEERQIVSISDSEAHPIAKYFREVLREERGEI